METLPVGRTHAIVLGASMAGLLTARVLSDHFDRVTILERDPVADEPVARKGQPQTRHLHGLLASGLQLLRRYYPDLPEALRAGGAIVRDMGEGVNWYAFGGRRLPVTVGHEAALMSRPFLEQLVRQRTLARPNITLRDGRAVAGLIEGDRRQVAGVRLELRDGGVDHEELRSDLVVDCGGRGSRSPAWLRAMGYPNPATSEVKVDVGYATRIYRRDPADPLGHRWTLVTPEALRETRFGGMFPIEGERWIVSLGGWAGDHCPTDEAGFLTYARSLPIPDIADTISRSEPLSEIHPGQPHGSADAGAGAAGQRDAPGRGGGRPPADDGVKRWRATATTSGDREPRPPRLHAGQWRGARRAWPWSRGAAAPPTRPSGQPSPRRLGPPSRPSCALSSARARYDLTYSLDAPHVLALCIVGSARETSYTALRSSSWLRDVSHITDGAMRTQQTNTRATRRAAADAEERTSAEAHTHPHEAPSGGRYLAALALGALGVVYGDIGTSPLYAMREAFHGTHAIPVTPLNIYGVLSLVFWSLIIVITVKYIGFIMRADNRGEGGILALTAFATPIRPLLPSPRRWLVLLGVFGAALLYGDGVITPAISVLSAVEGLKVATPLFTPYVEPITVAIIVGLFLIQSRGTGRIGRLFGPIMLVWFGTLAVLGVTHIVQNPAVLLAVNPAHAVTFFATDGLQGFLVLGTVFLVVTGGEALYADMGHFGRKPIMLAWFTLVLPALLLNYFGQGALLLANPEAAPNLFYMMAPAWATIPLVILSTLATIIASQALISGAFSITMQAQNLGFLPRLRIVHTSATEFGQIYIPLINWLLMAACIAVVLGFQSSSNLAAAYGIAVTSTMAITTLIFGIVTRERWGWGWARVVPLVGGFLVIDLAFLGANLIKIPQGGWFPLVAAVVIFTVMTTWKRGSRLVNQREQALEQDLAALLARCDALKPHRASGTAFFMSANPDGAPDALIINYQYNEVIAERVVLVTVQIENAPHVGDSRRAQFEELGQGFVKVTLRFGFMEEPNVPAALALLKDSPAHIDPDSGPFFVSRTRVIPSAFPGMALWREQIYAVMQRNAVSAADFFRLPPTRVVEIGTGVEM